VLLVRQVSDSACVLDYSWGFDRSGVWVDRGCRAEFALGSRQWSGFGDSFTIYCASDDGRRETCETDTRAGVSMVRQRSDSPCVFGSTWGVSNRSIWVDRGCRADFQLGGQIGIPGGGGDSQTVYCGSDNGRRNFCGTDTRGGVTLGRQISDSPCIQGRSWGWDSRGIWVDRGCRADFRTRAGGAPDARPFYCASENGQRNVCPVDTRGGVRLIRQRSDSDCRFGRTWGVDRFGIWVDRGCRADFQVGGGR
jgi:hypothetical protein